MVFESLYESALKGELLLIDGGMTRFHVRRDRQLTIREILATRRGAGSEMLARLRALPGIVSIVARCPEDLEANDWYRRRGFAMTGRAALPSGRVVLTWKLDCSPFAAKEAAHVSAH